MKFCKHERVGEWNESRVKLVRVLCFVFSFCLLPIESPLLAAPAPLNGLNSSVTIYVYPPRNPIDWSSPQKALKSFLGNILSILITKDGRVEFLNDFEETGELSSLYKSSMGHTIGHVRCMLPGGKVYDRWTSFSGQDFASVDKQILVKEKMGLGSLFYDYVDGHIISGAGNIMRLTYYRGDKEDGEPLRPRYMQFEVDAEHCEKIQEMVTFFEGFHYPNGTTLEDLEKRPPETLLYFTNTLDPYVSYRRRVDTGRGKVGGGCAPYGAALLKVGGRFKNEFDFFWKTPLLVSEKLIGGSADPDTGEVREVSLGRLLFSGLGSRWTYENEGFPNRRLSLYDPQKIWKFTGEVFRCLAKSPGCPEAVQMLLDSENRLLSRGAPSIFLG